jgi:hypothetical protein
VAGGIDDVVVVVATVVEVDVVDDVVDVDTTVVEVDVVEVVVVGAGVNLNPKSYVWLLIPEVTVGTSTCG